jgi:cytochrome c oxidase assembly factor CtaG
MDPVVLVASVLLVAMYANSRRRGATADAAFLGAVCVWLFASASPIATLARDGFSSAHALQHFLVVMIAAPLLVAGLGKGFGIRDSRFARVLSMPAATWAIGVGAMLFCHLPSWQRVEMAHPLLPGVVGVASLGGACIFWWPIFAPASAARLEPVRAIPYLATACLACTIAGIAIAFAPAAAYPMTAHSGAPLAAGAALRDKWGFTAAVDQQVSGLIIWVPGCLAYVGAMLVTLGRWYAAPEPHGVAT